MKNFIINIILKPLLIGLSITAIVALIFGIYTYPPTTLSEYINIFTAIFLVILTFLILQSNRKSNDIAIINSKPVISFYPDKPEWPNWKFTNIGNGPALHILVSHQNSKGQIDKPIRHIDVLKPGQSIRIKWLKHPRKFIAQYNDIYNNKYTVECIKNINKYHTKTLFNSWYKTEKTKPLWKIMRDAEIDFE